METVTRTPNAAKIPLKPYRSKLIDIFLSEYNHKLTANGIKEARLQLMSHLLSEWGLDKAFRDWLFAQGIVLIRKEHIWYLHFFDSRDSIKFVLMYT